MAAYIYFGAATISPSTYVKLIGEAPSDYFGVSVSNAGDVNGDDFSDVVVGTHYNGAAASTAAAPIFILVLRPCFKKLSIMCLEELTVFSKSFPTPFQKLLAHIGN